MRFSRPLKKPLIILLVNRGVFFLFILCALTVFLYAAGTRQNFTDDVQFTLLNLAMSLGIILSVGVIIGIILNIFLITRHKEKKGYLIKSIIVYIILGIFGISTAVLATFMLVVTQGNIV